MVQSITYRLVDALPDSVIETWERELQWVERLSADDEREIELRKRITKYEDTGHGACWLRDDRIAKLMEDALLHFDGEHYRLIAWCVMPNHVHLIIEVWERWPLAGVIHSWKSFTAHKANKILGRDGKFWFREYYDRYIRNEEHFSRALAYIINNPVKAGFVVSADRWRWSSASVERQGINAGGTPALPALIEKKTGDLRS